MANTKKAPKAPQSLLPVYHCLTNWLRFKSIVLVQQNFGVTLPLKMVISSANVTIAWGGISQIYSIYKRGHNTLPCDNEPWLV